MIEYLSTSNKCKKIRKSNKKFAKGQEKSKAILLFGWWKIKAALRDKEAAEIGKERSKKT